MMDNATYAMISKQISSLERLDVIANNVANANSAGYKSDQLMFKEYMHRDVKDNFAISASKETFTDFTSGPMKATGNSMDLAINGPGFFMVSTTGGIKYTRAGSLRVRGDGVLIVSGSNAPILSSDGQEIVLEVEDKEFEVLADGTLRINGETRAKIGIVEFEDLHTIRKEGASLFSSSALGSESTGSVIIQGMLEDSNVNAVMQLAILAQLERDVAQGANLLNESYAMQRNAFKIYSRNGG